MFRSISPAAHRLRSAAVFGAMLAMVACSSTDQPGPTMPIVLPSPTVVDIGFCGAPTWVAFQDGDGLWTHATPTRAGQLASYHHAFDAKKAGIAIARELAGGLTVLSVLYGTPNELSIVSDTAGFACGETTLKTVFGTVAPLGQNEVARLTAGRASTGDFVSIGTGFDFKIEGLTDGPHEILATRMTRNTSGGASLSGIVLRRIAALPDSATIPVIDFASAEAFQPVAHTVTFANATGLTVSGFAGLHTAHADEDVAFLSSPGPSTTYFSLPDARLEAGDLHSLVVSTSPVANVVRSATAYFHSATDRTITFGAAPSPPEISVAASTPVLRMRARMTPQPDYDRMSSINYQQGQNTLVSVAMTASYATGGAYDLTIPDFIGVEGFDSRWALRPTGQLLWTTTRIGGTLGINFNATPREGAFRKSASDAGFITP